MNFDEFVLRKRKFVHVHTLCELILLHLAELIPKKSLYLPNSALTLCARMKHSWTFKKLSTKNIKNEQWWRKIEAGWTRMRRVESDIATRQIWKLLKKAECLSTFLRHKKLKLFYISCIMFSLTIRYLRWK